MELVDREGRLFGVLNVVDAVAVLLVLAVVAAGTAFVLKDGTSGATEHRTAVTVEVTDVQPYVAEAVPDAPVETDGGALVEAVSVRPATVVVTDQRGDLHERAHPRRKTVTLRVVLTTTETDGETTYEGAPLEVGRELGFDLGPVTVEGRVTSISG
jgi:hypothetical protein